MVSRDFVFFAFNREEPNKFHQALKSETPRLPVFGGDGFLFNFSGR